MQVYKTKVVTVLSKETKWDIIHTDPRYPNSVIISTYGSEGTVLATQRFRDEVFLEFAEAIALAATIVRSRL